jgi:hypothetical protein
VFAAILELDPRSHDQRWYGTRNEDLAGLCDGRHPGTDVDRHPGNVVASRSTERRQATQKARHGRLLVHALDRMSAPVNKSRSIGPSPSTW